MTKILRNQTPCRWGRYGRIGLSAMVALPLLANVATANADGTHRDQEGREPRDVILVGSSSMNDAFGHIIAAELERKGYRVKRKGVAAAGFARPDFHDMLDVVEDLPANADLALVYLGMNDAQALWLRPHEREGGTGAWIKWDDGRWERVYEERARGFFEAIGRRGVKKAAVLLPIDVMSPGMQKRLDRIRALQQKAAASSTCAVAISTSGDVGKFRVDGEPTRSEDGVHMSRKGAQIIWNRIKGQVLNLEGV